LQWVQKLLPAAQIHVGSFPDALPPNLRYDSILLSSVDYFLNENELASTLQQARARLNNGGNCTLISWSFDKGGWSSLVQTWRERMEAILEQLSLHARRQFWGYRRNREEYHRAFTKSGFIHLIDEIIDTQTPWETYRITGHLT
jgi:hypothetical protein